jgi:hypothetical protein
MNALLDTDVKTHIPLQRSISSRSTLNSNGTATYHVLQSSRSTEDKIFSSAEERLGSLLRLLEFLRTIEFLGVFLKRLKAQGLRYNHKLDRSNEPGSWSNFPRSDHYRAQQSRL